MCNCVKNLKIGPIDKTHNIDTFRYRFTFDDDSGFI